MAVFYSYGKNAVCAGSFKTRFFAIFNFIITNIFSKDKIVTVIFLR
jgi:hypothetical protein